MSFLSTPIFARLLTQEEYGLYSNFASWQNTLVVFVALNMSSTFISAKFDYRDRFDSYISSTMFVSIISTLIWIVIINCFPQQVTSITGISIFHMNIMMFYILFNPIVEMFQARGRYKYEYKKSVAISLVISVGGTIASRCKY